MAFTYALYFFILINSVALFYISDLLRNNYEKKVIKSIAFFIVFIPFAFRYNIGTDYYSYNIIYDASSKGGVDHGEVGYLLINKFFSKVNIDFSIFVIFWSFLVLFFLFLGNRRGWWVFVLFFMCQSYLYFMSNFRTSFVYSFYVIIFLSIYKNHNEKNLLLKYFLCGLFLSFFHKTALLLILIPFLNKLFNLFVKNNFALFSFLAFFLIGFDIFYPFFVSFAKILGYGEYFEMEFFMSGAKIGSGLGVIARLFPVLIVLFFFEKIIKENKKNTLIIVPLIIYFIFMILAIRVNILNRVAILFSFSYPLAMWVFWNCQSIKYRKVMIIVFAMLNIIIFFRDISANQSDQCMGLRISPYVSIFNKMDDFSNKEFSSNCASLEM